MKVKYLFFIITGMLLSSCMNNASDNTQEESSLEDQISAQEEQLFGNENAKLNRREALEMVNLYKKFADKYPEDPRSPEFLFKAADISMNLNRPAPTIALFDNVLERYPDYEKAPTALFLKGFVLEDQMQNYEEARKVYELFLEKYPDSDFADDAEMSLKNLGKTPEELIREFEQGDESN